MPINGGILVSKRNTNWNEDKLNRWIKEGRGQGEGKDYKPWITVTDFPSQGRCARVKGIRRAGFIIFYRIYKENTFIYWNSMKQILFLILESLSFVGLYDVVQDTQDLKTHYFKNKTQDFHTFSLQLF